MKLTTFIIMIALAQVSASTFAQKLTFSKRGATLEEIFKAIESQTGYNVLYAPQKIDVLQKHNVNFKETDLEVVLETVLDNKTQEFKIENRNVLIKEKEQSFLESVIARFQAIDVRGRVVDSLGNALSGASISVKKVKSATTTNTNGEFHLLNVDEDAILRISYIGYNTKEVKASANLGNVVLNISNSKLDEIQVIAYGTTSKKFSTSNIGTIKSEEIARQPVPNLQLALAARVPGLLVLQQSGVTASAVNITVQGQNSLSNGNNPFYVIDGVPYDPQFTNSSLMGQAIMGVGGNAFNFINSADVESVSILKDADATAIYGSRAANGAILITTKKGQSGKTKIDVNLQNGWGKLTRKADLLNTKQYLEIRKEAFVNSGQAVPVAGGAPTGSNYDLTVYDQNKYTDWQKVLVGNTASYTDLQASVSGGSVNTQFLAGYGYNRQTTVYPGDLSDIKGSVHFNLNHNSNDNKFKFLLSGSYLQDKNQLYGSDLMNNAVQIAPNAPDMYKADGSINYMPAPQKPTLSTFGGNPAKQMAIKYEGNTNNLIANNTISYEIIQGLQIKSSMGFNRLQGDETILYPSTIILPESPFKSLRANYLNKIVSSWIIEPQLTYNKATKFGVLDALMGGTFQDSKTNILGQAGSGYSSDAKLKDISSASDVSINDRFKSLYRYNAIFGRLNYRLEDKYIINLNVRRDGSSRFGEDRKFHGFYSIGAGWLFGDEAFVEKVAPWLSSGKLRANYGTTGNDQITDYRYLSTLSNYPYGTMAYQDIIGLYPTNLANPLLQWEETHKLNFGLDLGFFDNRLLLNANYFKNKSSNQLLLSSIPFTTGFSYFDQNLPATVQNTGLELLFEGTPIKNKHFSWHSSFNITLPKNKIISFPDLTNSPFANSYVIGQPGNIQKVFKYAGVNSTTGLYEFFDSKGNRTSTPDNTTDRTALIDLNPKFYGGFNNSIEFRGFAVDFLFQFVKRKGATYKYGNSIIGSFSNGVSGRNQPTSVLGRWKEKGDNSDIQVASFSNEALDALDYVRGSDATFIDASFIRLKNVSFSYSLPASLLGHLHLSQARIYLQGQNLITITKYVGTDPESLALTALPPLQMFTTGLQVTF